MHSGSDEFSEEYQPVLFNIEVALTSVYQEGAEMTDWEAEQAISNLIRAYQAEDRGRKPRRSNMNHLTEQAYELVRQVCEWHLGRNDELPKVRVLSSFVEERSISISEAVDCLKRIRKSIQLWHKEYGRRGYYDYVSQFLK